MSSTTTTSTSNDTGQTSSIRGRRRESQQPVTQQERNVANRLRTTMAAVKLAFTWLGVRKTLAPEQRTTAARAFLADRELLSASKLILDTKNPAYRAVAAVRSKASTYWRTVTLPFPEAGIRLIPQNSLGVFASTMATYRERGCKTPSTNFLSTGGGGTSSGVVREVPHDQRGGVSRRRGWSGPVHLGRGTGPARSRDTADHPGEPRRAGLGRKLAGGHRAGA
jgi:hypothetical protein